MNTIRKGAIVDVQSVMRANIKNEEQLIEKRREETKFNLEQQKKIVANIEARINSLKIRQEMMVVCKRQLDKAVKHVEDQVNLSIQREHETEKKSHKEKVSK